MITTYEEYQKNYVNLLANGTFENKMVNPDSEPKFIINSDTRTITIPSAFEKGVAVYKDYESETLYFEIDRYFDEVDFNDKNCCVQFINGNEQQVAIPINYKYISEDNKKVILGWTLPQEISVKEGAVTFSIRFFSTKGDSLDYNWSTRPATINIYKGLYIQEGPATIPNKTTLEKLLDDISKIFQNGQPTYNYENLENLPEINGVKIVGKNVGDLILDLVSGKNAGSFLRIEDVLQQFVTMNSEEGKYPISSNAVQIKFESTDSLLSELENKINEISEELGDMSYVPINIENFLINVQNISGAVDGNPALVANGSRVNSLLFNWKMSKDPTTLKIGDDTIPSPKATGNFTKTFSNAITSDQDFILTAAEKRGDPVSSIAKLIFCDNTYWVVRDLTNPDNIDNAFILDYSENTRKLTPDVDFEIKANITENKYLYLAIPKSIGNDFSFYFNNSPLPGGVNFIKDMTINGINNYEAEYKIYRTTNSGLGQTSIRIGASYGE